MLETKHIGWVAVLALGLLSGASCGEDGGSCRARASHVTADAALARILAVESASKSWEKSVPAEVRRLVDDGCLGVLEFVDAELLRMGEMERRAAFHRGMAVLTVTRVNMRNELLPLLRRLAEQDKASAFLAPFREGGLEHLLSVLGDETAPVWDRITAAGVLGNYEDASVIERMAVLAGSELQLPFETDNELPYGPGLTLGGVVQDSIQLIRDRSGK